MIIFTPLQTAPQLLRPGRHASVRFVAGDGFSLGVRCTCTGAYGVYGCTNGTEVRGSKELSEVCRTEPEKTKIDNPRAMPDQLF